MNKDRMTNKCVNLFSEMKIIKYISACVLTVLIMGCANRSDDGDLRKFTVERFDRASRDYVKLTESQRDSIRKAYAPVVDFFSAVSGVSDPDSLMLMISGSQAVAVFQPDIETRLDDLTAAEQTLGKAASRAEKLFPAMKFPKRMIGFVMPYDQSVVVSDSVVMIGLNHYLGSDYDGYAGFDEYKRRLKDPSRIAYDVVEAVVRTQFPFDDAENSTVASRIAYEGAVTKMISDLVDDTDGYIALGLTPEDSKWVEENESILWRGLVEDGALYSIDRNVAERLVVPAPFAVVNGVRTPGRIGGVIGYRLVKSYLGSHPGLSAYEILNGRLYGKEGFVVESGYSGE